MPNCGLSNKPPPVPQGRTRVLYSDLAVPKHPIPLAGGIFLLAGTILRFLKQADKKSLSQTFSKPAAAIDFNKSLLSFTHDRNVQSTARWIVFCNPNRG